jgi:hypothetical protein
MKFDERNQSKILIHPFFIGWTNFAAVAMETKKGGFKKNWIPFIKLH